MNYDKQEEVSGGDRGDHPQAPTKEHNFIKHTEEVISNPSKVWNAGSKHTEEAAVLPKRKPLPPGKIAWGSNVDSVVVGKETKKQNVVVIPHVGVKAKWNC